MMQSGAISGNLGLDVVSIGSDSMLGIPESGVIKMKGSGLSGFGGVLNKMPASDVIEIGADKQRSKHEGVKVKKIGGLAGLGKLPPLKGF